MLKLTGIYKSYKTRYEDHNVLSNINLIINRGEKIGILGRNGSGKSTLIKIISGIVIPERGNITKTMNISWPLALDGGIQGSLTGYDNINFICRIYGVNKNNILSYVSEFSELGEYLYEPTRSYSSGMKARLNFALSMAINFDCLLIDEVLSVGDNHFKNKCKEEILVNKNEKAIILVSHDPNIVREVCKKVYVLQDRKIIDFDNFEAGFDFYEKNNQLI